MYIICVQNVNAKSTLGVVNGLYEPHLSILSVPMRNSTVNVAGEHH